MPAVSIVIPTYNDSDVLSRAIGSVLQQTFSNFEVIVVDDASDDDPLSVVEKIDDDRIRYLAHEENAGGSAARNTGIDSANGEFVAFLDADDWWAPSKLEEQLEDIRAHSSEWVGTYCDAEKRTSSANQVRYTASRLLSASDDDPDSKKGDSSLVEGILTNDLSGGFGSTLLARQSAVEAIGGFDPSFPRHQDLEFVLRLLRKGKLSYVDQTLVTIDKSSRGSASALAEGKQLLLEKFSSEVAELEAQGIDIHGIHQRSIAKRYFAEGDLTTGWQHLTQASMSGALDYLGVLWSLLLGAPKVHRTDG